MAYLMLLVSRLCVQLPIYNNVANFFSDHSLAHIENSYIVCFELFLSLNLVFCCSLDRQVYKNFC